MKNEHLRMVKPQESLAPERLTRFLMQLETTHSSQDVWELIVELSQGLGLGLVDYVCATDYRDWEKAQFIRTTAGSEWIDFARDNPNIRRMSYFRTHAVRYLTPIYVGIGYAELYQPSPDRLEIMKLSEKVGLKTGIGIPLRMSDPGQAAILLFGGKMERAEFETLMAREGWTLHAAALSAHTRYMELFRAEFVTRNRLSEKQRELITLVGQGFLDKQISHTLGISVSAVRQRMASALTRTGAANRAELAAMAMRVGLVPDPTLKPHDADLTVFLSTGDGRCGIEAKTPSRKS